MAKATKRLCPGCNTVKLFRADCKTCGCKGTNPSKAAELKEVNERTVDSWKIVLPKTRIHTLEQLVEYANIDLETWHVEKLVINKWEVGAKVGDEIEVTPLFQVKAFLVRRKILEDARKEIEALKELAKREASLPIKVRKLNKTNGNMLEIDITDHHFGKLAWGRETGFQNYDTKIAAALFNKALDVILERASSLAFDEIWFVVGNDLFNSDDQEGRTTSGTYVNTDVRYQKTFSVVRTVMIESIERLRRQTKKVRVIMVPGNHDKLSVWHLGDSLECYFHKYDDVVIDNEPKHRKYHEFGKVMIMYAHGDKGKRNDYPLLMATEQPEMFGRTKFREAHTGHNHYTKTDEHHGVIVRKLSALCPPDAWHAENGFVANLRSAEAFMWNKDEGLIGTIIYTDSRDDIEEG